jgi:hypothetical protein
MPSAVRLREDYSAEDLRGLARRSKDVNQSRRLLSLAGVAPQQASIPTTHGGSFSARAISVSRLTLRRITTAPDASSPTTLQTFLPRSMPSRSLPPPDSPASLPRRKEGRAIDDAGRNLV